MVKYQKNVYIFILLFASILLVNLASAGYAVNTTYNLGFTCTVNSQVPSNSAIFNITITDTKGNYLVNNQQATANGQGLFNYTVVFPTIDTYNLYEFCYDPLLSGNFSNHEIITITPNGYDFSTGQGILVFVFLLGGIGLFCLALYGSIKLPWKNVRNEEGLIVSMNDLKYLKLFSIVMSYVILLMLLGLAQGIFSNFFYNIGVASLFNMFYWIMLSIMWPGIVLSIIFAGIVFLEDKKTKELLTRGLPVR